MEDPLRVGRVDGVGEGVEDRQRPVEGEGTGRPAEFGERFPLQHFHDEVRRPRSGVDPGVGDVDDVGMAEPSQRLGLPLEAGHQERIEGGARLQELEREDLLEPEMGGAIDDADRSLAETAVQPVLPVEDSGDTAGAWSRWG